MAYKISILKATCEIISRFFKIYEVFLNLALYYSKVLKYNVNEIKIINMII